MKAGNIPSAPIRDLVRDYVGEREMGLVPMPGSMASNSGHTYSAVAAVALEFGITRLCLDRFLDGLTHREEMSFDLADHMLCKMDLNQLWWGDLRDIYYAADLTEPTPEKAEQLRKARERNKSNRATWTPEQREKRRRQQRLWASRNKRIKVAA